MRTMLLALIMIAVASLADAAGIDFTVKLYQLDGKPFTDQAGKPVETTLGGVCEVALLSPYPDEPNLSGEDKVKRFSLAVKIRDKKDVSLAAEEIALIKKLVAKAFPPLYVGLVWQLLDPASVPK